MANKKDIKDLVVCAFRGINPDPTKFSNKDVKDTLREEIHALASDYRSFQRNKLDLFEIMEEAYDEILPKYVEDIMGSFAEIKIVADKQKAVFRVKRGRQRAKQFITQVGLAGAYESFRLDSDTFELGGRAIGGAAYIDYERYICGDEDIAESTEILLEGIEENIMGEVQKALIASADAENRPAKNAVSTPGFDADEMAKLCAIAKSYGGGATIFATPEFVAEMGPDAIGLPIYAPGASEQGRGYGFATPVYSPRDIESIANTGYITSFRGTPIVQLPQSYTDETNEVTQINPGFAYIFPTGGEKIVKVVFEGPTRLDEFKGRDRSFEIEAYKKIGVAILTHHNWCIYENTDLSVDNTKYPAQH
jgi:hypothetical protein